jgi:hypothetical protein
MVFLAGTEQKSQHLESDHMITSDLNHLCSYLVKQASHKRSVFNEAENILVACLRPIGSRVLVI